VVLVVQVVLVIQVILVIQMVQVIQVVLGNSSDLSDPSDSSVAKLSHYLPFKILLSLYYSLVHTHLTYAMPLWASTHKTYL